MIVAIVFDTDDADMVESLSMAAEWDEGITIRHGGGSDTIDYFRLLDNPDIDDNGGVTFTMDVEE